MNIPLLIGRARWRLGLLREALRRKWYLKTSHPVGKVVLGDLRRLTPISKVWPNYRGQAVDRYYIEQFLEKHASDIQGHVLELGHPTYSHQFGGVRVTKVDVLHGKEGNPNATIVADLTDADHMPSNTYDCIILTQTLLLIYDVRSAVHTLHRILKPGGVILVTVPGITQIIRNDMEEYGQYWSFTEQSARRLFSETFDADAVDTQTFGNVLSATGFLYGLATEELTRKELDFHDPDYQLIVGVRAIRHSESN